MQKVFSFSRGSEFGNICSRHSKYRHPCHNRPAKAEANSVEVILAGGFLDLGSLTEEELAARTHSLAIENDEL